MKAHSTGHAKGFGDQIRSHRRIPFLATLNGHESKSRVRRAQPEAQDFGSSVVVAAAKLRASRGGLVDGCAVPDAFQVQGQTDAGHLRPHVDQDAARIVGEVKLGLAALGEESLGADDRLHDQGLERPRRDGEFITTQHLDDDRIAGFLKVANAMMDQGVV